jgi:hypothetical protein
MTDRIDRYVRGELSPQEARTLAQESLDSPALFDELTDGALAKCALNPATVQAAKVAHFPRRAAYLLAGAAAAVALIWIAPIWIAPVRIALPIWPTPTLKPVLELSAAASQPVLLASGLDPANSPVFRGDAESSRPPRLAGSIVSLKDGLANLNLGSIDGLAKGSELQVLRGSETVGRLRVYTVFRDRARAGVIEGKRLRGKDEVLVGGAEHQGALLQQVDAAFNRGDPGTALKLAGDAVSWGESAGVPPPAMAASWNQLAVLQMLRGEDNGVESLLRRAASASSPADPVYGESRNNLGVLAELRGGRGQAAAYYGEARSGLPAEERRIVDRNLGRVRGSR